MGVHDQTSAEAEQVNRLLLLQTSLEWQCKEMVEYNLTRASVLNEMKDLVDNQDKRLDQMNACVRMNDSRISKLEETVKDLQVPYDGALLFEIKNYSQKKAAAVDGTPSFYSDDFYTHRWGYRMCARIYLNGDGTGKGTHLSVSLIIKKGPNDNYLSWPFQRRVTFTLLNQAGKDHLSDTFRPDPASSSFHLQKPTKEMNIASGCPMLVAHKVIENFEEGYLRNNTIAIKIKVDLP